MDDEQNLVPEGKGTATERPDTRLIERWLPIAALGIESLRERTPMTPYPAPNRLHVWWARRPLIASRAAVLAAVLPADADREKFMHALGIHGDPVASRRRIDAAKRKGERFEGEAYSYKRAFAHVPDEKDISFISDGANTLGLRHVTVLDPTAGGGSIPFEAVRLGFETFANDLNPVAALIERATVEFPLKLGAAILPVFDKLSAEFIARREQRLAPYFPPEPETDCIPSNYLWARTIRCPYCDGLVPLSPNWRLAPNGTGVRLAPLIHRIAGIRWQARHNRLESHKVWFSTPYPMPGQNLPCPPTLKIPSCRSTCQVLARRRSPPRSTVVRSVPTAASCCWPVPTSDSA